MIGLVLAASTAAPMAACAGELFAHGEMLLRRGPGSKFSVVTTVGAGQRITVLWCNASANWCLVDDGLMQGWTPIDNLRRDASADAGALASGDVSAGGDDAAMPALTQATAGAGSGAMLGLSVGSGGVSVNAGTASAGVKLP